MTMAALKPTRLNKLLTTLWCGALLRKGPLCCGINCSCFNDVENPEASQARAKEAQWQYRSEKLAANREHRQEAAERRKARRERKSARRASRRDRKAARRSKRAPDATGAYEISRRTSDGKDGAAGANREAADAKMAPNPN